PDHPDGPPSRWLILVRRRHPARGTPFSGSDGTKPSEARVGREVVSAAWPRNAVSPDGPSPADAPADRRVIRQNVKPKRSSASATTWARRVLLVSRQMPA